MSSAVAMDEDALKRNTDCVYFLASPLTCKKGSKCEFRHSEAARMNPRDCWYWIHGTCRNPNCSFRHPPLEGKPAVPSVPPQSAAMAPLASTAAMPAAALASKSKTPCFFYSQNNCAKGDKCPFMHDPTLLTSAETASQRNAPKVPQGEALQGSKPVAVLKSVALNVTKSALNVEGQNDSQPVVLKAPAVSEFENPQTVKVGEQGTVLRSLVTSNPYRIEKVPAGKKSRVTLFSDTPDEFMKSTEMPYKVTPAEKRQGQPGRKQQRYEHEHSNSFQGAEHRHQNGSKMDSRRKNGSSSFDGDGSDQSFQREDGEYSPRLGNRGRTRVFEDTTSRVHNGFQNHGGERFESGPPQHRQPRYPLHLEQQLQCESDCNGTMEHVSHHGFSSGTRISVKDGQRMVSEGYKASIDLRDHLSKRRRDDRGHHPRNEGISRRGPSDMVDTPSLNLRRESGFNQKDQRGRLPLRGVEQRGIKRVRHDGGASPDGRPSRISPIRRLGPGRSPDRALSVVSPNRYSGLDYARSEGRERSSNWHISKTASVSDTRSHSTSKTMKSEFVKEDADFSGPKSLAQIKAEKQAELNAGGTKEQGQRGKHLLKSAKLAGSRSPIARNRQDSIVSTHRLKRSHEDSSSTGKRESKLASPEDFEGPKPLGVLLKEKEVESGNNVEVGMTAFRKSKDVINDLKREVEDGEVQDEEDEWKDDLSEYEDSPDAFLQEELAPRSESDPNAEDHVADTVDDMGSSDGEMRLEIGQTITGDEDYELDDDDDDDDDDFAKKLGGFFS